MSETTMTRPQPTEPTRAAPRPAAPGEGRLAGRAVILTGAAGALGSAISRQLLAEGARLVMTDLAGDRLADLGRTLVTEGHDPARILTLTADSADAGACRGVVKETVSRLGRLDAVVNQAGSTGAMQPLCKIPFTRADLQVSGETETMFDSAMNLLGGPWNMVRAAAPYLRPGASIVNVSTIFSRTPYYGRIPYVVPKSALNALSLGLARELGQGERAVRVNTVFPGPIESERIDKVFGAMDGLRGADDGTTAQEFLDLMILRRGGDESTAPRFRFARPEDLASTVLWLASDESAAFAGHAFELTHGMQVPAQSRSKLVSWPDMRLVDLDRRVVLILGGDDADEALTFAQAHQRYGAEVVLTFRSIEALERARQRIAARVSRPIHLLHLDPLNKETAERSFQFLADHYGRLDAALVLPKVPDVAPGVGLSEASDTQVVEFIKHQVVAPVQFASYLARHLGRWQELAEPPAVTFVSHPHDSHFNRFGEVSRAALEELIRVWRCEEEHDVERGHRRWSFLANQLVRFDNREADNLTFAADWSVTLANRVRKMDPINLWIPKRIKRATGKSAMPMAIQRVLMGLHQGRTALITGGSVGIGMQLGRFLAIAGARVILSSRGPSKLEAARARIVGELENLGYPDPGGRVATLPGVDVGDEQALSDLVERAAAIYGDIDMLINNAGISGAEQMVVDMDPAAWERTMEANLVSNYSLIRKLGPRMKLRGRGKILNVSSYFGGEKYVAVAYPNRADYAVSKAGQRALAEILSRHLGPEIQINALAPGPVSGARLHGSGDQPGLFARRGRLILANKRLNHVHAAVLASLRQGAAIEDLLELIAINRVEHLRRRGQLPGPMLALVDRLSAGNPAAACSQYLVNARISGQLLARLRGGGLLTDQGLAETFCERCVDAPEPFFPADEVDLEKQKIEGGILNMLHLHRMPTDVDVAVSTVFHLADDNVSGETFHPSGGLKFDRSVTEGEFIGKPGREDLKCLANKNVVLIGEVMIEEFAALTAALIELGAANVRILTCSDEAGRELCSRIPDSGRTSVTCAAAGDDLEAGLDAAARELGHLDVVVSAPFARLPLKPLAAGAGESWDRVLTRDDFANLCREQLTHHFRVARKAALQDRCEIILVTPDTTRASTREEFALALFVKTALHAFTVTLGVEGERIPTTPAVNQVQLTRRARKEEPRNDQEAREERDRFVAAVLQCALPAPRPQDSRYLSRIYRGNAVTV